MTRLPDLTSASLVRSFSIVSAGVMLGLLLLFRRYLPTSPLLIGLIIVAGLLCVAAAVFRPILLQKAYSLYKTVAQRVLVPLLRRWILAVVFFIVLWANRPYAKRLRAAVTDSAESMWHPKTIRDLLGGSGTEDVVVDEKGNGSWLSALFGWIKETGNWWVITLIPFMVLLSIIDGGQGESSVSEETYTLY